MQASPVGSEVLSYFLWVTVYVVSLSCCCLQESHSAQWYYCAHRLTAICYTVGGLQQWQEADQCRHECGCGYTIGIVSLSSLLARGIICSRNYLHSYASYSPPLCIRLHFYLAIMRVWYCRLYSWGLLAKVRFDPTLHNYLPRFQLSNSFIIM